MTDDLEVVRRRLGLGPWAFWGMSGGGWIGQQYAERHPAGVRPRWCSRAPAPASGCGWRIRRACSVRSTRGGGTALEQRGSNGDGLAQSVAGDADKHRVDGRPRRGIPCSARRGGPALLVSPRCRSHRSHERGDPRRCGASMRGPWLGRLLHAPRWSSPVRPIRWFRCGTRRRCNRRYQAPSCRSDRRRRPRAQRPGKRRGAGGDRAVPGRIHMMSPPQRRAWLGAWPVQRLKAAASVAEQAGDVGQRQGLIAQVATGIGIVDSQTRAEYERFFAEVVSRPPASAI